MLCCCCYVVCFVSRLTSVVCVSRSFDLILFSIIKRNTTARLTSMEPRRQRSYSIPVRTATTFMITWLPFLTVLGPCLKSFVVSFEDSIPIIG